MAAMTAVNAREFDGDAIQVHDEFEAEIQIQQPHEQQMVDNKTTNFEDDEDIFVKQEDQFIVVPADQQQRVQVIEQQQYQVSLVILSNPVLYNYRFC